MTFVLPGVEGVFFGGDMIVGVGALTLNEKLFSVTPFAKLARVRKLYDPAMVFLSMLTRPGRVAIFRTTMVSRFDWSIPPADNTSYWRDTSRGLSVLEVSAVVKRRFPPAKTVGLEGVVVMCNSTAADG